MTLLPHPIIVQPFSLGLGPIQLTGFGLGMFMCFVIGQFVAQRLMVRRGLDPSPVPDMIFTAVVSGLLGAKLYYVVVLGNWHSLFDRSGFVFWGGFIAAFAAVSALVVHKRLGYMRMADIAAPACAAAYAVGRTGCWAIGDDYGRPWTGFLAVAFPHGAPPSTAGEMAREFGIAIPAGAGPNTLISVVPTQLMEVALGLVMFGILWRLKDHAHAEGWLWGVFLVLAGAERFIVEFFRAKDDRALAGLTYAQGIALVLIVAGVAWMAARWRVGPGKPGVRNSVRLGESLAT
ncbi:MAG: lgt [Gemmatimonadetes bacterium]|jgi:phosphatidylglycerol:prolipoprotein diacylglycerol transferase|nr:lgt [Gemmatimonadota bacterium]